MFGEVISPCFGCCNQNCDSVSETFTLLSVLVWFPFSTRVTCFSLVQNNRSFMIVSHISFKICAVTKHAWFYLMSNALISHETFMFIIIVKLSRRTHLILNTFCIWKSSIIIISKRLHVKAMYTVQFTVYLCYIYPLVLFLLHNSKRKKH